MGLLHCKHTTPDCSHGIISVVPHLHSHIHTHSSWPMSSVVGETGVPGGNLRRHTENMQSQLVYDSTTLNGVGVDRRAWYQFRDSLGTHQYQYITSVVSTPIPVSEQSQLYTKTMHFRLRLIFMSSSLHQEDDSPSSVIMKIIHYLNTGAWREIGNVARRSGDAVLSA